MIHLAQLSWDFPRVLLIADFGETGMMGMRLDHAVRLVQVDSEMTFLEERSHDHMGVEQWVPIKRDATDGGSESTWVADFIGTALGCAATDKGKITLFVDLKTGMPRTLSVPDKPVAKSGK